VGKAMKISLILFILFFMCSSSLALGRTELAQIKLRADVIELGGKNMNDSIEKSAKGFAPGLRYPAKGDLPELIIYVYFVSENTKGSTRYKEVQFVVKNPDEQERGCKAMKVLFESEDRGPWTAYVDKFDYENGCTPTDSYKDELQRDKVISENHKKQMKQLQSNKPLSRCYDDCLMMGTAAYFNCKQNCNMKFKY
jgi:hypothetical protein